MTPEWFLVLAPAAGIGTFLLASLWPTEADHEVPVRGLGLPGSHVDGPAPRVPTASVHTPTTEEGDQEMSDTSDKFNRSVALEKAFQWKGDADLGPGAIVEAAEKFRAFLAGETKTLEVKAKPEYVYFKYNSPDSSIYYRSRLGSDAFGSESLERLTGGLWKPSNTPGNPKSFGEILTRTPEYKKIPESEVPREYR